MAVPMKPPTGDNNENRFEAPKVPQVGQMRRPVRPTEGSDDAEATRSFRGASLDDREEAEEKLIQERMKNFSKVSNGRVQGATKFHSELTAEDLIKNSWGRYEHLMPKVVEVKGWLTTILSEQNRTVEVAAARAQRGKKYDEMYALMEQLLIRHFTSERVISGPDSKILMALVINEILGLGPIEPLWRDDRISEIMVNGPFKIRIEMQGKLMDVPGARFRDADHLLDVSQQILAPVNRTIDVAHPLADGSLVDGSRVNIVHPVLAKDGPYITIRRFPDTVFSLQQLVKFKSMNEDMATDLGNWIHAGLSTVVIGGTGSGKTSTLNALSGCIPPGERVLVIEDTSELRLHPERDILYLQARTAQQDGHGAVTIRDLVRNALRMRPDRIVVGEVRGFEAYDMLQAMNTGHDGSMTTVHANDARSGVERLVNLLSEGDGAVESNRVLSLISSGVDLFVTIQRYEDGSRRCSGIYEIPNRVHVEDGKSDLEPVMLWEFEREGLDEDDKIIGHWKKGADISDSMVRKHSLNHHRRMDIKEIYEMSEQAGSPSADK
jgi:pilus assembly protein CpaF